MHSRAVVSTIGLTLLLVASACGGKYMGLPPASAENGYGIVGYVGKSSQEAAPSENVVLVNEQGTVVSSVTTDVWGKYKLYPLQPGTYILKVGEIERQVVVATNHQRIDIDLSKKDGSMNYAAGAMKKNSGGSIVAQGPNDPELQKAFAGYYWGYSGGSTMTTSGGTERKQTYCANGNYFDGTQTSMTVDHYDDNTQSDNYGRKDMTTMYAGKEGSAPAKWTISGTLQSGQIILTYRGGKTYEMKYSLADEANVYMIDGAKLSKMPPQPSSPCR